MRVKRLFAIHRDAENNIVRTKIAEGTTADFVDVVGFQIEDFYEGDDNGDTVPYTGLNGTYPALEAESFKHLEGDLLTICEAALTNKDQREAFKRVLRGAMWDFFNKQVEQVVRVYEKK